MPLTKRSLCRRQACRLICVFDLNAGGRRSFGSSLYGAVTFVAGMALARPRANRSIRTIACDSMSSGPMFSDVAQKSDRRFGQGAKCEA